MHDVTSTEEKEQLASPNMLLWLAAIGFFMQTLDATIVNTALPAMARSLQESPLRMQAVVISYALAMAMLIPASGWLADRFGTRKVFFSALVLFGAGSLLCAYSPRLIYLVIARVIQGFGGAMLLPVGRLAVLRAFPREKFLQAMSLVTVPGLLGPLIGPALGGWLVEFATWHWIFLIKVNTFRVGILGNLFARLGSACMPFLIPLLLQLSLGYTPLQAGLMMIPVALAGIVVKRIGTPLIQYFGYRCVLLVNTILVGLTICSFAFISPDESFGLRLFQLTLFGAVNSMQFTAMNTLTLKDLESGLASSGNGLLSMVMMLSMSLGVATAGALLSTFVEFLGRSQTSGPLSAFHATFICMGLLTAMSASIFWQLSPDEDIGAGK